MLRLFLLVTILAGGVGCDSDTPSPDPDLGVDAAADAVAIDVGADLAPDVGATVIDVALGGAADDKVEIGSHRLLSATVAGNGTLNAKLSAAPCLLKLAGKAGAPVRTLSIELSAGGSFELVVFAPLDAAEGASCLVSAEAIAGLTVQKRPLAVAPPIYKLLQMADHQVSAVGDLKVVEVGVLESGARQLRALTFAGGAFDDWVAAVSDPTDASQAETSSTVRLYRFDDTPVGTVPIWIDLEGKAEHPMVVEDMVWSPLGPCQGGDSLYIGADSGDPPGGGGDEAGGVYCINVNQTIVQLYDDKARSLDIDRVGGFVDTGPKGGLYTFRWGGHFGYPGPAEITQAANPALPISSRTIRFAHAGAFAGHLYVVPYPAEGGPTQLKRVAPLDGTGSAVLLDVYAGDSSQDVGTPTLSSGGPFGQIALVPGRGAAFETHDLIAVIEDPDARTIRIVKSLTCGRATAIDEQGRRLAVITGPNCNTGPWTAHILSFDLP